MIVYNVTVKIENGIRQEWLEWMSSVHIPEVLATGCFVDYRILHLLGQDDSQGTTYAIQYRSPDINTLQLYMDRYAPALQKAHKERYEGKFVAFRTLLQTIEEGIRS